LRSVVEKGIGRLIFQNKLNNDMFLYIKKTRHCIKKERLAKSRLRLNTLVLFILILKTSSGLLYTVIVDLLLILTCSGPPRTRIPFAEKVVHGVLISAGVLAGPMWILAHIQDYKKRD
jgi:hypothetical protein